MCVERSHVGPELQSAAGLGGRFAPTGAACRGPSRACGAAFVALGLGGRVVRRAPPSASVWRAPDTLGGALTVVALGHAPVLFSPR